jgi:hypothetical protein
MWALTPDEMKECRWLKPQFVVQIAFTEWTLDGHLRTLDGHANRFRGHSPSDQRFAPTNHFFSANVKCFEPGFPFTAGCTAQESASAGI